MRSIFVIIIFFILSSPVGDIIQFTAQNDDSFYNKEPYKTVYNKKFLSPETFEGNKGYELLKQDLINGFRYILDQRDPKLEAADFPIWTTIQSLQDISEMKEEEITKEVYKNFGVILTEQYSIISRIREFLNSEGWFFIDTELSNDLKNAVTDTLNWIWDEVWKKQATEPFGEEKKIKIQETQTGSGITFLLNESDKEDFNLTGIFYKNDTNFEANEIKAIWVNGSTNLLIRNIDSPDNLSSNEFYVNVTSGQLILGMDLGGGTINYGYEYTIPYQISCLPNGYKSSIIFDIDEDNDWLSQIRELAKKYDNREISVNMGEEQTQIMLFRVWADRFDKFVDILNWASDLTDDEKETWKDRKIQIEIIRALNWCYYYQKQYHLTNITYNATEFWNRENSITNWNAIEKRFNDSLYQAISAMRIEGDDIYNEEVFENLAEAKQAENLWNTWFQKLCNLAFFKNLNTAKEGLSILSIKDNTTIELNFASSLRSLTYLLYLTPRNQTFPVSQDTYDLYKRMWAKKDLEGYEISEYVTKYNYTMALPNILDTYRTYFELLDPKQNTTQEFGSIDLKKRLNGSFGALRLKNHQIIKRDIAQISDSSPNSLSQVKRYREYYYLPLFVYYLAYLVIGDLDPSQEVDMAYEWLKTAIQLGNYLTYSPDASIGAIDPIYEPTQTGDYNKTWTTTGNFLLTYLPTWDEFKATPNAIPDQPYYNYSLFNATPKDQENRYYRSFPAQGAIHNTQSIFAYDLWNWIKYYNANDFPEGAWEEIKDNYAHMQHNMRIAIAQVHATSVDENWSEILEDGSFKDYEYLTTKDIGGWLSGSEDYVYCRDKEANKEVWKESSHSSNFTEKTAIFATLNALESIMSTLEYIVDRPAAGETPVWGAVFLGVIFVGILLVIVYVYWGKPKTIKESMLDTNARNP